MNTQPLSVRDVVVLHTPESPTFDGLLAEVVEVKEWGAMVCIRAVHVMPDGRRQVVALSYRALWEEVDYVGPLPPAAGGAVAIISPPERNGTIAVSKEKGVPTLPIKPRSPHVDRNGKVKGEVTGKYCKDCGGANMIRTGTCETCQDCGSNEGCG